MQRKSWPWILKIKKSYSNLSIRSRIALQFSFIVAIILGIIFTSVIFSFSIYRKLNFSSQLKERAIIAAEKFLSEDNVTKEKFQEIQNKYQKALPGEKIALFDKANKSVFIENQVLIYDHVILEKIRTQNELAFSEGPMECYGIYYHDNQGDYVIISSAKDSKGDDLIRFLIIIILIASIISLAGVYFLGLLFAKNALSPISNIIIQVSKMGASNLNLRVNEGKRKDELGRLAKTFNNLLSRLEKSFEMQKSFVSGASHEFRTPITSIIGEIEVCLSRPRDSPSYIQTLEGLLVQAEKLGNITESLLSLTRTGIEFSFSEPIRLDQLVFDAVENLPKTLDNKRIELVLKDLPNDSSDLIIYGNKALLILALCNILSNALKFSKVSKVIFSLFQEEGQTIINVQDFGIGIETHDLTKIFQPFYRGINALEFSGTGIGLSLTEKIINMYSGQLLVNSLINQGTVFQIRFSTIKSSDF